MQSSYRNVVDRNERDVIYDSDVCWHRKAATGSTTDSFVSSVPAPRKRSRNESAQGLFSARNSSGKTPRDDLRKSFNAPERGGHSISKRFDFSSNCFGKSPRRPRRDGLAAFCLIEPSGTNFRKV